MNILYAPCAVLPELFITGVQVSDTVAELESILDKHIAEFEGRVSDAVADINRGDDDEEKDINPGHEEEGKVHQGTTGALPRPAEQAAPMPRIVSGQAFDVGQSTDEHRFFGDLQPRGERSISISLTLACSDTDAFARDRASSIAAVWRATVVSHSAFTSFNAHS